MILEELRANSSGNQLPLRQITTVRGKLFWSIDQILERLVQYSEKPDRFDKIP